jgi:hypothetical protein
LMVIFLLEKHNNNIQFDSMCIWEKNDDAIWCYWVFLIDRWYMSWYKLGKMTYIKTNIINSRTCPVHPQRENPVQHNNHLI